jgi:hypothetical protein
MFHDAIKAVCSACVVSASNPCIETVLLTQNVSFDDSLVSDIEISAIDWHVFCIIMQSLKHDISVNWW